MSKIVVGKKFERTKIRNWFAFASQFRQAGPMRDATIYNRNNRDEVIRELEEDDIDHDSNMDCWD